MRVRVTQILLLVMRNLSGSSGHKGLSGPRVIAVLRLRVGLLHHAGAELITNSMVLSVQLRHSRVSQVDLNMILVIL